MTYDKDYSISEEVLEQMCGFSASSSQVSKATAELDEQTACDAIAKA